MTLFFFDKPKFHTYKENLIGKHKRAFKERNLKIHARKQENPIWFGPEVFQAAQAQTSGQGQPFP